MVIELYFELVKSGRKVEELESLLGITDFCFMFQFDVKVYLSIMMGLVKHVVKKYGEEREHQDLFHTKTYVKNLNSQKAVRGEQRP